MCQNPSDRSETFASFSIRACDAIIQGIQCPELPDVTACQFCDTVREHIGILSPFSEAPKVIAWLGNPEDCDCVEFLEAKAARLAAQERDRDEEEVQRERERATRQILRSGIKQRFLTRTLDSYVPGENSRALKLARRYVETFEERSAQGFGIYFVGPVGVGKTHLAVAIGLALIEQGVPVLFTTSPDMLSEVRETYSAQKSEEQVLSRYRTADVLILDDIGKESPSEWTCATLFSLMNDRYESMMPTIITTQYSDAELHRRLGGGGDKKTAEALVSRLHEMCYRVDMQGPDWRNGERT